MIKRIGRTKLKEKDRAKVHLPVRVTEGEYRGLKEMAKAQGELYIVRIVRKLIQEALKQKGPVNEEVHHRH